MNDIGVNFLSLKFVALWFITLKHQLQGRCQLNARKLLNYCRHGDAAIATEFPAVMICNWSAHICKTASYKGFPHVLNQTQSHTKLFLITTKPDSVSAQTYSTCVRWKAVISGYLTLTPADGISNFISHNIAGSSYVWFKGKREQ